MIQAILFRIFYTFVAIFVDRKDFLLTETSFFFSFVSRSILIIVSHLEKKTCEKQVRFKL